MLACPICRGALALSGDELVSTRCGARYPVVCGVPILLPPQMVAQGLGGQLGLDDNVSMHPYSEASNEIIESNAGGWVLDLGAGGKHIEHPNVVQMDVFRFPMTDVVGSADCLPFAGGTFRAVVSQAVFEHLQYPDAAASEVWRVLSPDGVAKIDTAFLQPEHAYPHHYFNATEAGLRHWFRDFDIEWSGVEPYQHPKWSLVWFLSVYFASLPDDHREILARVSLGECLDVLSRLSRGVLTADDLPIVQALDALVPNGIRSLAAGVSVRAIKRVADVVVPRKSDGEDNGRAMRALEMRLDQQMRVRRIDADFVSATRQMLLIAADRSRFLLHARDVAAHACSTALTQVPTETLLKQLLTRWLPSLSFTRSAELAVEAPAFGEKPILGECDRFNGVSFVVRPQQSLTLLDQFFSLARQTHSEWELIISVDRSAAPYLQQLARELACLDSRVRLVQGGSLACLDFIRYERWALLTPDTVLDFGAVLELVSLGSQMPGMPLVCDVGHWDVASNEFVLCHGFVPEGLAPPDWYSEGGPSETLSLAQPWVAYPTVVMERELEDVDATAQRQRPGYVPKILFRRQPFAVA